MNSLKGIGAQYLKGGSCLFRVWAPLISKVELHLISPKEQVIPLTKNGEYHEVLVRNLPPGALYFYILDGQKERPDPASRFQPQGVHGPSQVIDPAFSWTDKDWRGIPLPDYIIYELHVGTFTKEGSFQALIPFLEDLRELGITAIELMPVSQFPGLRNWGYDGVYPFAVQNSYGGPAGLKELVNSCHLMGLAVILDVIYNHLGPEGNYLRDFGPYFTSRYQTPWGEAVNFDGPYSDEVRNFFLANALYWIREFHVDALRLDALHAVYDFSARPFLQELADVVKEEGEKEKRKVYLIGECDLNDQRLVQKKELGGYGLDALWNDDFHHALHTLLTGEKRGYYQDFGEMEHLAKSFVEGFVFTGQHSSFRRRRQGSSSRDIPAWRLVVFSQNHDQIGNRPLGERLSHLVNFSQLKLAAAVVLLSPFIPLIFMGEEYGEKAPFLYFISHTDPDLVEKVKKGRQEEFADFFPEGKMPDPYAEGTFAKCRLNHELCFQGNHKILRLFYQELIKLRRNLPPLKNLSKENLEIITWPDEKIFLVRRWTNEKEEACLIYNFAPMQVEVSLPILTGEWVKKLDSAEKTWHGEGSSIPQRWRSGGINSLKLSPQAVVLLVRQGEI
ncbi:MAG: malto-oligosyltrehalose trehalohydrolase [Thermodesulfobacteriota bacterium]